MQDQFSELTGLRIIAVDNDLDNRALYSCFLESLGANVMTVASVGEAFTVLTQFTPDILISDIALPNVDGYALLRKLRASELEFGQSLPAIAVSGYIQGNDELLALAAGFQKWLPKPIDLDQLINTIAQVVQHQRSGDLYGSDRENKVEV